MLRCEGDCAACGIVELGSRIRDVQSLRDSNTVSCPHLCMGACHTAHTAKSCPACGSSVARPVCLQPRLGKSTNKRSPTATASGPSHSTHPSNNYANPDDEHGDNPEPKIASSNDTKPTNQYPARGDLRKQHVCRVVASFEARRDEADLRRVLGRRGQHHHDQARSRRRGGVRPAAQEP